MAPVLFIEYNLAKMLCLTKYLHYHVRSGFIKAVPEHARMLKYSQIKIYAI